MVFLYRHGGVGKLIGRTDSVCRIWFPPAAAGTAARAMSLTPRSGLSLVTKAKGVLRLAGSEEPPAPSVRAQWPTSDPRAMVLMIGGEIARADVPRLCSRIQGFLEDADVPFVICDVNGIVDPDAAAVDVLARLQLVAGRIGCELQLRSVGNELRELLVLAGLSDVLPSCDDLRVEPGRQPEQREEPLGVEEEVEPGDPSP